MLTIRSRQFWEVFFTNLGLNLKSEVSKTYLGYFWWLLEPVFYVTAMYVVLGIFLSRRTENFMLFLVLGQVPFSWFSRSVSNASRSIMGGKSLINTVAIPKIYFPLLTTSQDVVKQMVVFVATLLFILIVGQDASWSWLGVIPVILTQFLLIIALGLVFAAIVPMVPDFSYLITTMMMVLMWGSGIFYSYKDVLLAEHRDLFLLNPMANLIKNYRQVVLDSQPPDWAALGLIALASVLVVAFMAWFFNRNDTLYARLVVE
jgi:lipopolysaccharide transport system permease protein